MNNEELRDKRREFLKSSALIAGGVLLNQFAFAGGHSSTDDTIKIALIGCGDRGTGAAFQALSTTANVKLVAMADAFQDRMDNSYKVLSDKFKDKVDVPRERRFIGFDAYQKAIALADVVLLVTPPGFRPTHFEEAVKQGKHVFMEKPVAVDAPGIRRVLAAAEIAKQKKLNVVVVYSAGIKPITEKYETYTGCAIGEIYSGQVYWNSGAYGSKNVSLHKLRWNTRCVTGIIQLVVWRSYVEQHVHNIDIANWVKGAYPVLYKEPAAAHGDRKRLWRNL